MENIYVQSTDDVLLKKFMNGVYTLMAIGILITGIVALFTVKSGLYVSILQNRILFYALMFAEIGLVLFLVARLNAMSSSTATMAFLAYSALNGLTMSVLFVIYTRTSVAQVFFITAGMFGLTSFYGMVTKKDLSGLGSILFMGLIGIIIASVVNIFFKSPMLYWVISYAGVVLFTALTAYDTQKIKNMYLNGQYDLEGGKKLAIYGALQLYLDFVNLFIMLLRIFGKRN